MSIGENIKRIRKEKGLTQRQLGDRLGGISQQQIGQWENNNKPPKIETIQKIANALNISYTKLFDLDNPIDIRELSCDSRLDGVKHFIKEKYFQYSKEQRNALRKELDKKILEGNKIQDLDLKEKYFYNLEVEYTHKLLEHVLEPLKNEEVLIFSSMIAQYLYMNSNAQSKIVDYTEDLYGNPLYHDHTIDELITDDDKKDED